MSEAYEKPLPFPDRDSQPFWEGVRAHELRLQRCDACGTFRWPPRSVCRACHSFKSHWAPVSGRGRIVSWVRTHQVFLAAFREDVPYTVIQVALEDQPDILMIGQLVEGAQPAAELRVRAVFHEPTPDATLVQWEPLEGAG